MPPTAKENDVSTARPEASRSSSTPTLTGETAMKQQPVALEVPVSVNGARAVDGSDKREPFSESTKTVLIFGSGAVIRLSSSVAPGQLLFLTNEKTKKEVVCQVVKSKNYRNVSGYVELEFTEPVVGFWGMRFPSDRIGSAPQPAAPAPSAIHSPAASGSSAVPRPVAPGIVAAKPPVPISAVRVATPKLTEAKSIVPGAPKVEELLPQKPVAPAAPLSSSLSTSFDPEAPLSPRSVTPAPPVVPVAPVAPVSTTPEFKVDPAPVQPFTPGSVLTDSPRASESQASFLEPAKTSPVSPTPVIPNLLALFEGKQAAPADDSEPAVQVFVDPETETLKQHTARLQEQLSSMAFSEEPAAAETVSAQIPHAPAVVVQKELAERAAKVLEQSKIHTPEPAPSAPIKPVPPPMKSSLDEELKIPSWLEPLARNAAAPSSTQELIEREKTKRLAEQPKTEEIVAATVTPAEEFKLPELPLPTFANALPLEKRESTPEGESRSSNKGLLIGAIAASILLLGGGGWWYMQQQSGSVPTATATASNVQASSVASVPVASSPAQTLRNAPPQTNPPAPSNPAALKATSAQPTSASNTPRVVPAVSSAVTARSTRPTPSPANPVRDAVPAASAQPSAEEPKKSILGEVQLLKPKVSPSRRTQNVGEPDAAIALTGDEEPAPEGLNAGLAGSNAQPSAPAAPVPIGGDVKQARLVSSVPPVYPSLAKTQHVSGNVQVDALIDATGRVTTMKVVSGPTLLHQAAMDALRQWKYQPATLDGKPVAMHLTVTIQFRLQ
jgi:TonB family protein